MISTPIKKTNGLAPNVAKEFGRIKKRILYGVMPENKLESLIKVH